MTDVKDDPREVLALLNSLGFVGITAPQLKAFMKDLKMYRKIKEHEKQQWKEETRKKILSKQERMLSEIIQDEINAKRIISAENITQVEKSSRRDDPLVRIKIHCVTDDEDAEGNDKENKNRRDCRATGALTTEEHVKTARSRKTESREDTAGRIPGERATIRGNERVVSREGRSKTARVSTHSSEYAPMEKKIVTPRKNTQRATERNRESRDPARPLSAPDVTDHAAIPLVRSKSVASDPTGLANARNNPSRCSSRSNTKSFIRPWRLQPDAQHALSTRKSDPVALYQKYQQEWKQISFPGEEQHARVRWAIREKMLGTDPNPRPILKKSQSLMSIKKR